MTISRISKLCLLTIALIAIIVACKTPAATNVRPGKDASELNGTWELVSLPDKSSAYMQQLYPAKKPFIRLSPGDSRITGYSGCNNFSGAFIHKDGQLDFTSPFASTKMACGTDGENVFFETLKQATAYRLLKGNKMELMAGEKVLMQFRLQ